MYIYRQVGNYAEFIQSQDYFNIKLRYISIKKMTVKDMEGKIEEKENRKMVNLNIFLRSNISSY